MSSPLKQNTTTIQELLNKINNLPEAENLDTELNTQATLLSEQDAKIAELAEILAGKAGGGSGANIIHSSCALDKNALPFAIWCEDGMTWEEYINSRYNIVGTHQGENYYECTVENNKVVPRTHSYYYISIDGTASGMVSLSDKIIADLQYMCYFDD